MCTSDVQQWLSLALFNTQGQIHITLSNKPWLAERRQYSPSWRKPFFCFVNSVAITLPLSSKQYIHKQTDSQPSLTHHLALSLSHTHPSLSAIILVVMTLNNLHAHESPGPSFWKNFSSWDVDPCQTKLNSADVESRLTSADLELDFRKLLPVSVNFHFIVNLST